MLNQNDLEWLQDMLQQGKITADQATLEKVRMARVQVVSSLPASVRSSLNMAVKEKRLGHMKKSGLKPEVYYHPEFEHLANTKRKDIEHD